MTVNIQANVYTYICTCRLYNQYKFLVSVSYMNRNIRFVDSNIAGHLEKHGLSVWVDVVGLKAGVDFLSKIGQAIIDAKVNVKVTIMRVI